MIRGNFALDPGRQQMRVTGGGAAADFKFKIKRVCTVSIGYYNIILQSVTLYLNDSCLLYVLMLKRETLIITTCV